MTRSEYLGKADSAARRAANLAGHSETWAHNEHPKADRFAAAANAWSEVARIYVAIARTMPTDEKQEA
ncbi:hypothetical protein ACIRU3_29540 [Streptomyces sp. NPDC101151]|uniref:hypothetical protein n=1 Tax=Streptomyces sp. NPDC101151 TaxID=3366115 RepID=UPI003810AA1C